MVAILNLSCTIVSIQIIVTLDVTNLQTCSYKWIRKVWKIMNSNEVIKNNEESQGHKPFKFCLISISSEQAWSVLRRMWCHRCFLTHCKHESHRLESEEDTWCAFQQADFVYMIDQGADWNLPIPGDTRANCASLGKGARHSWYWHNPDSIPDCGYQSLFFTVNLKQAHF